MKFFRARYATELLMIDGTQRKNARLTEKLSLCHPSAGLGQYVPALFREEGQAEEFDTGIRSTPE